MATRKKRYDLKAPRASEPMTGPQRVALIVLLVIVVFFVWRFRQVLDGDAIFYESRVAAHQQECADAQEAVRLAEVTR